MKLPTTDKAYIPYANACVSARGSGFPEGLDSKRIRCSPGQTSTDQCVTREHVRNRGSPVVCERKPWTLVGGSWVKIAGSKAYSLYIDHPG